jgi:hypothetical protein
VKLVQEGAEQILVVTARCCKKVERDRQHDIVREPWVTNRHPVDWKLIEGSILAFERLYISMASRSAQWFPVTCTRLRVYEGRIIRMAWHGI